MPLILGSGLPTLSPENASWGSSIQVRQVRGRKGTLELKQNQKFLITSAFDGESKPSNDKVDIPTCRVVARLGLHLDNSE